MIGSTFSRVHEWFVPENEDESDPIFLIIGMLIATAVTLVVTVLALPLVLGRDYETYTERLVRHHWVYIVYAGVGAGVLVSWGYGYAPSLGLAAGFAPIALYAAALGVVRLGDLDVDGVVPDRLSAPGQPSPNEFDLPMESVDQRSDGAPRRPSLQKDESTMAIGSSRSGKTSALKLLASQIDYDDTAVIAHGSIDEYSQYFAEDRGLDVAKIGVRHSTVRWNLFRDCQSDRDLEMVARGLFGDGDDYFETSARQVFGAVLKLLDRENQFADPGHAEIRKAVTQSTAEQIYEKLQQYPDLQAAAEHLDPSAEKQQRGVWSQVVQVVSDVFVEDFGESGSFSFRQYLDNPQGRAVVIESPEVSRGVGPMYRVLVDEVIEQAMTHHRDTFLLLDELDTLPELDNLSDLAARGLAQDTRMLLGVQTVGQLRDVYGQSVDGVIGNTNQVLGLTPGNDTGATVEYYQSLMGERRETVESYSRSKDARPLKNNSRVSRSRQEEDRYPIDEHTMNNWAPGECLVSAREQWWTGKLAYYGDIKTRYD
jgi:hypothetical protein